MTGTSMIVPANLELPAHLRTADAAAAIAAANAAAAGGIKTGGFPRLSKKGSKFSIIDGDTVQLMLDPPAQPGYPPTPKMLLRVVIVAANPNLSKICYEGEWEEGSSREPDCKSSNGITPDLDVKAPFSTACATCPKNQWGSKISKATGKEVKACDDTKTLAIIPAEDMDYKAVGLILTPSELKGWGGREGYITALTGRNIPVDGVITNLMFDATASHPKIVFSFGGFLTEDQCAKVKARATGDDVQAIVSQRGGVPRTPQVPQLPAPAPQQAAPAPAPAPQPAPVVVDPFAGQPDHVKLAVNAAGGLGSPAGDATYAALTGKPASAPATAAAQPAPVEAVTKRTRSPRKPPEAAAAAANAAVTATVAQVANVAQDVTKAIQQTVAVDPLAHIPAEVRSTIALVGADSELGKGLIAKYPVPGIPVPTAAPVSTGGFGGVSTATPPTPAVAASAAATATAGSLAAQLKARIEKTQAGAPAGSK